MTSSDRLLSAFRQHLAEIEAEADNADGARWYFDYLDDAARPFFDRWLPAAVLRQVAAFREICDAYERALRIPPSEFSSFMRGQDDGYRQAYHDVLRALARGGLGINPDKETG